MNSYAAFKQTNDDWDDSFYLSTGDDRLFVEVDFLKLGEDYYRVVVWGTGEYGLVRDYGIHELEPAFKMYISLLGMKSIDIEPLKAMGFHEV